LVANAGDTDRLQVHITTMTGFVDAFRALGVNALITFYDAVLARLLIAAAAPDEARNRLQIALDLADQTGMHFYDAELLRLRAHTRDDPERRRADLLAAVQLARRQDAWIFELRSAADQFDLADATATQSLTDA